MTGRALVGLALLVGLTSAVPVGPSVLAAPDGQFDLAQTTDTLKSQPTSGDTVSKADTIRPYHSAKSPGAAVLLSFLLPGGGQVYTGNWWKTTLIAPAEVTLGYLTVREHLLATQSLNKGDTADYSRYSSTRTALLWWTGAVIVFSMADAYVSAQMYGFDRETKLGLWPSKLPMPSLALGTGNLGLVVRAGIAMGF
ncbi:MAG TPA: DUF5683 domain-containing protein [bacterium]|nr:DUF5683 domain-containing protein [bacterium]